jgi:hypothetical protein
MKEFFWNEIIGTQTYSSEGKPQKLIKKYFCVYCGCRFEHYVSRIQIGEGKDHISTQVKCPACSNLLPTGLK